ncbi:hypothetical protein CEXT_594261 [Caerostris extrusa]|uniref:Uncharacterized protein n=1 Tax=Caerostris extrusa TaxID=172846 RepID=A0AAV4VIQ3_CAEEX|nr:hypothetical protein CEXT_594261 [Caerostris extrusa]
MARGECFIPVGGIAKCHSMFDVRTRWRLFSNVSQSLSERNKCSSAAEFNHHPLGVFQNEKNYLFPPPPSEGTTSLGGQPPPANKEGGRRRNGRSH